MRAAEWRNRMVGAICLRQHHRRIGLGLVERGAPFDGARIDGGDEEEQQGERARLQAGQHGMDLPRRRPAPDHVDAVVELHEDAAAGIEQHDGAYDRRQPAAAEQVL